MKNIVQLSKKDTRFLNKIISLNKEFNILKKKKDIKSMYVILYKMRVLHGVMLTRINKYSGELYNEINNNKIKSKEYYNLSVYNSLIDSAKELINNAENHLQHKVLENNKKELSNNTYFELETNLKDDPNNNKLNNDKPCLILYYTEWCGFSRQFLPVWDDLEKDIKNTDINIDLIKIDCEKNKDKCINNNIRGYPTVVLEVNGKKIEYKSMRNVESIKKFIIEHCK